MLEKTAVHTPINKQFHLVPLDVSLYLEWISAFGDFQVKHPLQAVASLYNCVHVCVWIVGKRCMCTIAQVLSNSYKSNTGLV